MRAKLIKGYGGWYKVREDGTVWSCRVRGNSTGIRRKGPWWRMRPGTCSKKGHQVVHLSSGEHNSYLLVHRLVLEAFVGPCPPNMECRHYPDQDPSNNRLENLSWATPKVNQRDRQSNGTVTRLNGEQNPSAKLSDMRVRKIREEFATGSYSQQSLATKYNISLTAVHKIVRRKTWGHI